MRFIARYKPWTEDTLHYIYTIVTEHFGEVRETRAQFEQPAFIDIWFKDRDNGCGFRTLFIHYMDDIGADMGIYECEEEAEEA